MEGLDLSVPSTVVAAIAISGGLGLWRLLRRMSEFTVPRLQKTFEDSLAQVTEQHRADIMALLTMLQTQRQEHREDVKEQMAVFSEAMEKLRADMNTAFERQGARMEQYGDRLIALTAKLGRGDG